MLRTFCAAADENNENHPYTGWFSFYLLKARPAPSVSTVLHQRGFQLCLQKSHLWRPRRMANPAYEEDGSLRIAE